MPRTTETAANPKPAQLKTSAPKSAGGRPPKYDWSSIRREYIRGDERVTYLSLSTKTGYPSHDVIKSRAAREDWTDLRAQFQHKVAAAAQNLDLETLEEVRNRQARIGKALQTTAVKGMAHLNPQELSAFEVARLAQVGSDLERKARGMEEFTVRVEDLRSPADLKNLTPEQLLELRARVKGRGQA
ncbi:hypothetical protein [Deinococcus aquiradiocola]|uniref:Terminase small subunit n=1 Tax=Deinococcus aquiradiocola TaxID=393059 RepID=A0A917P7E5_9DEIO|nr:hypothetical protein [Deinococcus aquiradiocola]GGJ65274.1 hypothetical protein GCM10008939_06480 [Deinococcus aquiradiocola]